jgi:predicted RNA-binding protein YlqC (UPF0109 family)
MKEFVEFLVTSIVTKPEEVKIEESINDTVVDLTINVAQDDMGLLIGKGGRTIRSVRNLAKAKAIKEQVKVNIVINEN